MTSIKTCMNCTRIFRSEDDFFQGTSRWRIGECRELYFNCNCGTTLLLPEGRYEWYHPEKLLSPKARETMNRLVRWELLPRLPEALYRLQAMISDPASSVVELADAIRMDPVLAADILRLASGFKRVDGAGIASIGHAVAFVGRRTLADLAATASVGQIDFATKMYTRHLFWRESFVAGYAAEALARLSVHTAAADAAYVAASLANVGKVIMACMFPEALDRIYAVTVTERMSWNQAEQRYAEHSHEILGEIASVLWALPGTVRDVAASHHGGSGYDPDDPSEQVVQCLAICGIHLSHILLEQPWRHNATMLTKARERIGLGETDFRKVLQEGPALLSRVAAIVTDFGYAVPSGAEKARGS